MYNNCLARPEAGVNNIVNNDACPSMSFYARFINETNILTHRDILRVEIKRPDIHV